MFRWLMRLFGFKKKGSLKNGYRLTDQEVQLLAVQACQLVGLSNKYVGHTTWEVADACNEAMGIFMYKSGYLFSAKQTRLAMKTIRSHAFVCTGDKLI